MGMAERHGGLVWVGVFEDVVIVCLDGPNVGDRVLDLVSPDVWSNCSTKSGSSFEGDSPLLETSDASMEWGTILIHSKSSSLVLECVVPGPSSPKNGVLCPS